MKSFKRSVVFIFILSLLLSCAGASAYAETMPQFTGEAFTVLSENIPDFTDEEKQCAEVFELYGELDSLGRCTAAFANICEELMPTEPRGNISEVHPTGWHSGMGWERCHLIGFQLAGENANEKNLITGTRYFNVTGMLPFENMVADFVKEMGYHVLYRVTPVFEGKNLIASGVIMEAWSQEDEGEGICFKVFVHNVQPGKNIDYKTGEVTAAEPLESTVTLKSKTAYYTGKSISIASAVVTGSTGKVSYTYYTNSTCTNKTTKSDGASKTGAAPKNAGTYYVKASVAADLNYSSAESKAVKLTIKKAKPSLTLKSATKGYTGKAVTLKAETPSTGTLTYTYYTNSSCTKKTTTSNGASSSGKAPKKIGTYYVIAKQASDANYNPATSEKAKLVITKGKQTISVKTDSKSYTVSELNSSSKSFSIGASATAGKLSCSKASGSSCLSVSDSGRVSVKKGTAAGTYTIKVKITAAQTTLYNSASVTETITVKVNSSSQTSTKTVYWTSGGSVYHLSKDCRSLARSSNIQSGTIAQSLKDRVCSVCG